MFCILPDACNDLQGLAELALELPEMAHLFVDGGYNFYECEDYLLFGLMDAAKISSMTTILNLSGGTKVSAQPVAEICVSSWNAPFCSMRLLLNAITLFYYHKFSYFFDGQINMPPVVTQFGKIEFQVRFSRTFIEREHFDGVNL